MNTYFPQYVWIPKATSTSSELSPGGNLKERHIFPNKKIPRLKMTDLHKSLILSLGISASPPH